MNKQTKMLLGVALIGAAGYMLWKQSSKKTSFTGPAGDRMKFTSFSGGVQGPHEYNGTNFVGPQGLPKDKTKFTKFVGESGTGVQGGRLVNGKQKFYPSNFGK